MIVYFFSFQYFYSVMYISEYCVSSFSEFFSFFLIINPIDMKFKVPLFYLLFLVMDWRMPTLIVH